MKYSCLSLTLFSLLFSVSALADATYYAPGAQQLLAQAEPIPVQPPVEIQSVNAVGEKQHTIVDVDGNLKVVERSVAEQPMQRLASADEQPNAMPQHGQEQPQMQQNQMPPPAQQPGQMQSGQMQPGQMQQGQMQPGQMQPGQLQPGQMQQGQMQPNQMQKGDQMHQGQQMQPGQMQVQVQPNGPKR